MKRVLFLLLALVVATQLMAQKGTKRQQAEPIPVAIEDCGDVIIDVPYTPKQGGYKVKCTINRCSGYFLYDPTATAVTISAKQVNKLLKKSVLSDTESVAVGDKLTLRIDFSNITCYVVAKVVAGQKLPLIIDRKTLSRLGKVEVNQAAKLITITSILVGF